MHNPSRDMGLTDDQLHTQVQTMMATMEMEALDLALAQACRPLVDPPPRTLQRMWPGAPPANGGASKWDSGS